MTATLEPLTAGDVYEHQLDVRPRGRLRQLVLGALDLWCAASGGSLELSRAGDVVVRRRVDGVEELRVPAGPVEDPAWVLDEVKQQLESMSPDEFRAYWDIA